MANNILAMQKKKKLRTIGDAMDLAENIRMNMDRARAICALARVAHMAGDELDDNVVENAMWAAEDLLREADENAERISSMVTDHLRSTEHSDTSEAVSRG